MRSETFRNVSLGVLALVLAYSAGAMSARAQSSATTVTAVVGYLAYCANGDVYTTDGSFQYHFVGNVFSGPGPVPVQRTTWGQVKERYLR